MNRQSFNHNCVSHPKITPGISGISTQESCREKMLKQFYEMHIGSRSDAFIQEIRMRVGLQGSHQHI
jgi:hypothetical protein